MEYIDNGRIKIRYKSIDCLKFLLAICVVGIHTSAPFGGTLLGLVIQQIVFSMSVPLFFAISGFFFYAKLQKDLKPKTVNAYCWRLGRIYIIWSLLYIPHIVTDYHNHQGWGIIENGIVVLIRNIFFLGSYNQLWYLLASIWGGILLYFSIMSLKSWKKTAIVCIAMYFIAMLFDSCSGILPAQIRIIPALYHNYFNSVRNGLLFGFPFMGVGVVAYQMQHIKPEKAFTAAVLFFVYRIMATYVIKQFDMEYGMEITPGTWGCSLFLLIWLLQVELPISDKLSQWFRKSSIIVFLIHPYIIDLLSLVTENSTVLFALVVLFCLAVSGTFIALEEKRIGCLLKYLY